MNSQRMIPDSGVWEGYEWKIYTNNNNQVICELWDNEPDTVYKYTGEHFKNRLSQYDYIYPKLIFDVNEDGIFCMKLDGDNIVEMKVILELFINILLAPRLDCYNRFYDDLDDLKYSKEIVEELLIRRGREKMLLDHSFNVINSIPVINNDNHMVIIDPKLINLKLSSTYHRLAMHEDDDEMYPYENDYFDVDEDIDLVYNYLKYRIDFVINNL